MVIARILYKNKSGWKTMSNAPVYHCADSVETIVEFARENARKRRFVVQPNYVQGTVGFAQNVFNVDSGENVRMIVDSMYGGPGASEKDFGEWIFSDGRKSLD